MLITEKRLRQIVSSELRRMFLSEAKDWKKMIPVGLYADAAVFLDPIMEKDSNLYSKFTQLVMDGRNDPAATQIVNQLKNPNAKTNKNRFIFALIVMVTGKAPTASDLRAVASGDSMVPSLGLKADTFEGVDYTTAVKHLGTIANNSRPPADTTITFGRPGELEPEPVGPLASGPAKATKTLPMTPGGSRDPSHHPYPKGQGEIDYTIVSGDSISAILNKYYGIPFGIPKAGYEDARNLFYTEFGMPPSVEKIKPGMKMMLPKELKIGDKNYTRKK